MVTVPHRMVRLERMLDYRGFGLQGFYSTVEPLYSTTSIYDDNHMQWKKKMYRWQTWPLPAGHPALFGGLDHHHSNSKGASGFHLHLI